MPFGPMQAFTGTVPFIGRPTYAAVVAMLEGNNPSQPTHPTLTKELWVLMERCWDHDPRLRPGVTRVLRALPDTSVSRSLRRSYIHRSDHFPVCSTAWKRFIDDSLSKEERIYLATRIFSTQDRVELAESLAGEDAQNFVDAIDEASRCALSPSKNAHRFPLNLLHFV